MSKVLYLMRHGQTRFNLQKRIQGACDSPLTKEGIEQAELAHLFFKNNRITFDAVYSSTQERACDTAEIASGGQVYTRLKGLKEWDFGAFEGQQEYLNPPLYPKIGYGDYFETYGGESYLTVAKRMTETITGIMENTTDKTVLMVSHGGAISRFYNYVLDNVTNVRLSNCVILKFIFENGQYSLEYIYDPIKDEKRYSEDLR